VSNDANGGTVQMIGKSYSFVIPAAAMLLLLPCASPSAPGDTSLETPRGIVDCLLPGVIRRVGGNIYQMPQRPARITATECTIRGGDFLLYDRANYDASLKHWIAKAEQGSGDSEAMLYVAEIYEQGIGRDPDFQAAARWYQKASDAGNTTAMIGLAHLYKTGQGVPVDLAVAQSLYSQAFGSDVMIPLDPSSVKGADQRVETLVAEVDEIRREKIAVELELVAANQQLDNARRALNDTLAGSGTESSEIKRLQASITSQQAEIEMYRLEAESVQTENEQLQSLRQQLRDQRGETEKLQAMLDAAESEYQRSREYLKAQREALEAEEAQFNDLLGKMDSDRAVIQASKMEVDQLRDQVNAVEAALRKAEDDRDFYQALASERTSPEERVAALSAQITLLEQKSNGIENQTATLSNAVKTKQDELDAQIAAAAKADELSREQIAARDEEIARLQAAISRAETEKERHTSNISRLERQSLELETLRADLEREQAQSNRLQQLLTKTQEQFSASNEKLEQVTATRTSLEAEIESLRAAATGDDKSQAMLAQRQKELAAARGEIEQLQLQIADSEDEFRQYRQQMADTAARQTDAIANLRAAVTAGRTERIHLEEQLSSANQQLASAQSDLELERQRFAELQDELRLARAEKDDSADSLEEKQRKLDEQNQQLAMLQQEIERLNDQSDRYVTQINELTVMAQAEKIDFAGPKILLMEPNENVLANNTELPSRGAALTRGISVVAAARVHETKVIRGHVEAPAGLAKLTINGMQVPYDDHYSFTQPFELDEESKHIRIVAVDHNGKDDQEEFEYRTDGTLLQASTVHNKAARFEESRNTALDHLKYYALIIANKDYENERFRDLETPFADAEEVAAVLRDRYRFKVDVVYNANKAKIEEELERIFYKEPNDDNVDNDKDAVLIYYAGHGYASDSRTKEAYYWLPVDAEFDSPRTWYKTKDLEAYMQVSAINQIMVVADSCFAGNVLSRDGLAGNHASLKSKDWRRYLTEYTEKKKSRYVLTSGGFAPVLDGGGGNHSVFARAFLDVLESNTEILSAPRMHEQVAPEVMKLAEQLDFKQTPLFGYLTSAGHEFGNFYLPAPHAAVETAAQTTAAVGGDAVVPAKLFAQASLQ
jgi:predicted  nucleic acid-binding Zn-ribbon protein